MKAHSTLPADPVDEAYPNILERAEQVAVYVTPSPRDIKKRITRVLYVLSVSLVVAITACLALVVGAPSSDTSRQLLAFMLLCSGFLVVAATVGLGLISWNAYVQQRFLTLEARFESQEASDELVEIGGRAMSLVQDIKSGVIEEQIVTQLVEQRMIDQSSKRFFVRALNLALQIVGQRVEGLVGEQIHSERDPVRHDHRRSL